MRGIVTIALVTLQPEALANVPGARWSLKLARHEEAQQIADALQTNRVVGLLGEAEVGKTETLRQALGHSTPKLSILRLDLDGVAGEEHLAFQISREIARAVLSLAEFSTLKVGVLVPTSIEAKRIALADLLGVNGLDESLRDWPSGRYPLARALEALEKLAKGRDVFLWLDHLEAPGLTPRHPLDLDHLLWAIREMVQRLPDLNVVLSGRDAVEGRVLGREAAFHQQGRWLSLDNPGAEAWLTVGAGLEVPAATANDLAELTGGHPETMLLALLELTEEPKRDADDVLRYLASTAGALTARAMQHARSLHRLGGQILIQVASGLGPYAGAQRGESPPQEIRKVLGRLHLAGLIRHDEGWSVVNPLIRIALRDGVHRANAPDWDDEM